MSLLVDTSVWVQHFRKRDAALAYLALLASTLITPGAVLWTRDKRLVALAMRFGVAHQLQPH